MISVVEIIKNSGRKVVFINVMKTPYALTEVRVTI